MYSNTYISIILIIGIAQGIFLSLLLFTLKRGNKTANRLLAGLLLLFTLMIMPHAKFQVNPEHDGFHNEYYIHLVFFLIPPLLFFYVKAITGKIHKIKLKDVNHFIPFFIFLLLIIPLQIVNPADNHWHLLLYAVTALLVIQMLVYLYCSINVVNSYRNSLKGNFSSLEKINLNWLRFLLWGQLTVWMLFLVVELINFQPRYYMWVLLAVFIYLMGYFTLKQPEIIVGVIFNSVSDSAGKKKYAKSALTPEISEKYYCRLKEVMEESKPYLRDDLSLQSLAELVSITGYHLSQVINEKANQNFFEFVNGYRVKEAKKLLTCPGKSNYSIAAIGYDAGFSSVSSFNSVFKKSVKMTPSEFRKSLSVKENSSEQQKES